MSNFIRLESYNPKKITLFGDYLIRYLLKTQSNKNYLNFKISMLNILEK